MPEMHFEIRWPDGETQRCYSPSLIIRDYFVPGERYPVETFMVRAREALNIASERVKAKYGYYCSSAMDELKQLEARAEALEKAEFRGSVEVVRFDPESTPSG